MSILCESEDGWIISHSKFFENIKFRVDVEPQNTEDSTSLKNYNSFKLDPQLFEIVNPFIVTKKRNPKNESFEQTLDLTTTSSKVEKQFKDLLNLGLKQNVFLTSTSWIKTKDENNRTARQRANAFYNQIQNLDFITNEIVFFGRNTQSTAIISEVSDHSFIFPQNTIFYCQNVTEIENKLKNEAYDLIIMDPPWRNKYIRRRKRKQAEAG